MSISDERNRLYGGCLDELPELKSNIIRVFSSSTFTDYSNERNHIMKKSVPKIKKMCFMRGLIFQMVDMRWGVRDEASVDHTTNDVVLGEVEKSKKMSRGPYMLAFLGDRYGSRSMPSKIKEAEFRVIRRTAMKLGYDITLLDKWFKRDDNAEPALYYLLPITKYLPNYDNDLEGFELQRQHDRDEWDKVNEKLTIMLRRSADLAYDERLIDKDTRHKYFYSVTEAEIQCGILDPDTVKDKVICYFRSFLDLDIKDKLAWRFTDITDGHPDDEAAELRERLKVTKVMPKLGPDELKKYSLYWTPVGIDTNNADHCEYLDNLCTHFEGWMEKMIDKALKSETGRVGSHHKADREILHHLCFTKSKLAMFCGRESVLESIKQKMSARHTTEKEVKDEVSFKNDEDDADDNESTSSQSLYQSTMNSIIPQSEIEEFQKQNAAIKEQLSKLDVVYTHGDNDLDIESDPNRNPKAEILRLPSMKTYSRPVIIYGNSGSGKTTIMAKIVEQSRVWFPNSIQIVRFFGTSPNSSSIRQVLLGLCLQIRYLYQIAHPFNVDLEEDFQFLSQYFLSLLWRIKCRNKPLVIILDSVDQLKLNDHSNSMHWLPLKLPPDVHIVVSMLPHTNDCLDNIRSLLPQNENYVHIPPLSLETADAMVKMFLQKHSRRLTKIQWRYLFDKISKVGQPLYVLLLSNIAVTWKSTTVMSKTLVGNNIIEAINGLFDGMEKEHGQILIQKLIGYFSAARDGLSLNEMEDILALDDEVLQDTYLYHLPPDPEHIRMPSAVVTRALSKIMGYIVERQSGTSSVLAWYHRQFIEVSKQRYVSRDRELKLYSVLADFFLGIWYEKKKPLKLFKKKTASYPNAVRAVPSQPLEYHTNMYNTRKLIELPYHLIKCQRFPSFRDNIACSYNFLYAKCKTVGIAEVINDLKLCEVAMDTEGYLDAEVINDIKSVLEVLQMGVDLIRKDANNLSIQIMSRLCQKKDSASLVSLVKEASEWCKTTSNPLLVPCSHSMPGPGGVLKITFDAEIFASEDYRIGRLDHVMYLHEDVSHLFVLSKPSTSYQKSLLSVFDLADNASCVFRTELSQEFIAVSFLANNKYLCLEDCKGHDQVSLAMSPKLLKLSHPPDKVTVSQSGKYIIYSSVSKVYVCKSTAHGGVGSVQFEIDTDQVNKPESDTDLDKKEGMQKKKMHVVEAIFTSPDEKFLVVYNTLHGFFKVWSMETGHFLYDAKDPEFAKDIFSFDSSERSDIANVAMITKENLFICRKEGYKVRGQLGVFDLNNGTFLRTLDSGSKYKLTIVSMHSTQRFIGAATSETVCATGHGDKVWKIWDIHTGDIVSKAAVPALYCNSYGMNFLKLFGSDKIFTVSSHHKANGALHVSYCGTVDKPLAEVVPVCSLLSHTMEILQLVVSSDDKLLISASKDNSIKIWDLEKLMTRFSEKCEACTDEEEIASKLTADFERELSEQNSTLAIGVHSKEIYAALSNGELVIQDLKSNQVKHRESLSHDPLTLLVVGSVGDFVIAATGSGNIIVWDIAEAKIHKSLQCKHKLTCMVEAKDCLVGGQAGMEGKGSIWNIRTGELMREVSLLYSFYTVAINASGTKFVSSMFDFPIVVSLSSDHEEGSSFDMSKIDTMMSAATCTAISPDESLALCGSVDGSIRVITMSGTYKFRFCQKSTVVCAQFSPDSQQAVSGGYKSIYVWSLQDGSLKFKVRKHDNFILNIKFDEQGTHMLTTGRDKRIVLWDFRRGISLTTFYAHCQVKHVALTHRGYVVFVPDGVSIAATLKPNPVLKKMLKGKYSYTAGSTFTNAQGVALGFSSQKIQSNSESAACQIL